MWESPARTGDPVKRAVVPGSRNERVFPRVGGRMPRNPAVVNSPDSARRVAGIQRIGATLPDGAPRTSSMVRGTPGPPAPMAFS